MPPKHFTVILHLEHFFNDHRMISRIFVHDKVTHIKDFYEHIENIFNIDQFYLTCENHYLPPSEDIRILQPNDKIWAKPLQNVNKKYVCKDEKEESLDNDGYSDESVSKPLKTTCKPIKKNKSPDCYGYKPKSDYKKHKQIKINPDYENHLLQTKTEKHNNKETLTLNESDVCAEKSTQKKRKKKTSFQFEENVENETNECDAEKSSNYNKNKSFDKMKTKHYNLIPEEQTEETYSKTINCKDNLNSGKQKKKHKTEACKINIIEDKILNSANTSHRISEYASETFSDNIQSSNTTFNNINYETYSRKLKHLQKFEVNPNVKLFDSNCYNQQNELVSQVVNKTPPVNKTNINLNSGILFDNALFTEKNKQPIEDDINRSNISITKNEIIQECADNLSVNGFSQKMSVAPLNNLNENTNCFDSKTTNTFDTKQKRKRIRRRKKNNFNTDTKNSSCEDNNNITNKSYTFSAKPHIHIRFDTCNDENIDAYNYRYIEKCTDSIDIPMNKNEEKSCFVEKSLIQPLPKDEKYPLSKTTDTKETYGNDTDKTLTNESALSDEKKYLNLSAEDITKYPKMETFPSIGNILAFKILHLSKEYTPEVSEFIIAKILKCDMESNRVDVGIIRGKNQLSEPEGKFFMEKMNDENSSEIYSEETHNFGLVDLLDKRLIFN